jgi:hypothetical protein
MEIVTQRFYQGEIIMPAKTKRKPYVDPISELMNAARQTKALRRNTYSFKLMRLIQDHNHKVLLPALEKVFDWTRQIDKDVKQLEAKWIRAQLQKLPPDQRKRVAAEIRKAKAKGGKRVSRSS